ncbi:MAG: hypothetical protein AABZ06_10175, partial [Bdellovibrionota bacterium]
DINPQAGKSPGSYNDLFPENAFYSFTGELNDTVLSNDIFHIYEKALRRKAPLALKKAMELVDRGLEATLDEGLKLELGSLKWVFNTDDAMVGLSGILKKEKFVFSGR